MQEYKPKKIIMPGGKEHLIRPNASPEVAEWGQLVGDLRAEGITPTKIRELVRLEQDLLEKQRELTHVEEPEDVDTGD